MGKSRGNPRVTFTYKELGVLAGTVGLVEKSQAGQDAFEAWWKNDTKAARAALFSRVVARREAAVKAAQAKTRTITAAEAQAARSGEPTAYPAWMGRRQTGAAASVRAATAAGQKQAVVDPLYPPGWLGAAGQARRSDGVAVVEVND